MEQRGFLVGTKFSSTFRPSKMRLTSQINTILYSIIWLQLCLCPVSLPDTMIENGCDQPLSAAAKRGEGSGGHGDTGEHRKKHNTTQHNDR